MKKIEEIEKALVVVDMVNGFVKEGNMATPYMKALIPIIEELLQEFEREEEGIIFIKESHDENCAEFNKFPEHCKEGTWEAEIIEEYAPYVDNALVFRKNTTMSVFAPGFIETLRKMKNLKEVVFVGGCTDICSMEAALPTIKFFDSENRDVKVIFPMNANDTYDAPNHNRDEWNEMAYKFMNQAGISVVKKYHKKF